MSEIDWRRIDIDKYDVEAQYEEDELPDLKPDVSLSDIDGLIQQVRGLIQRNDIVNGLSLCIENAPYGARDVQVTNKFLQCCSEILLSVKMSDIPNYVHQFNIDQLDVIVKFLYTLMGKEFALKQAGLLLVWLDKIVESVGEGPIIRFMSDPYKL